jgi:translocation and assembly module TamB
VSTTDRPTRPLLRRKLPPRALRILLWVDAVFALTLLAFALLLLAIMGNTRIHRYLITLLETQVGEQLGVGVHLQNFALHPSSLSVDLYGITLDGANPYPAPPLLQVQHVKTGVRIVSLLKRKWYLSDLRIDHPVVQVFMDKNGVSNLPRPKSSSNSNTTVFDLGIRHALLDHGEVFFNDRPATLSADLHNFEFRASFDDPAQTYSGDLAYTDGRLEYGTYRPLPHALSAEFSASPTTLRLTRANLSCGPSSLVLSATVNNYSSPIVDARYDAVVDGDQIAQILHNPEIPKGSVRTSGSLRYANPPSGFALEALTVDAALTSRELIVKNANVRTSINNIAAHYSLANGNVTLRDFQAYLLGGALRASGAMKNLGGKSSSNINAALNNISLADLRTALGSGVTQNVALTGTLNATASASWGKTFDDLVARSNATIDGNVTSRSNTTGVKIVEPSGTISSANIPLNSVIYASYSGKTGQLALNNSYLRTSQTELTMNGIVGNRSSLALHLQANDLSEISTLIGVFQPSATGSHPLDLAGHASFVGNVQGSTAAPHLTGQLVAQDLRFNGTNWKVLRTGIDLSPSHAALQNADIESSSQGRITLNAGADLSKWSILKTSPVSATLNVSQMAITDLLKLAGQPDIPATGMLNANLSLHGTELNPTGNGTLSLTAANIYDQTVQSARVVLAGSNGEARAQFTAELPGGAFDGTATVRPQQRTYTANLTSNQIHLDKLQILLAHNIDAKGIAKLDATGQGTFDNPQLNATLEIPKLTIQDQSISGIRLQAALANHVANATLASTAFNTPIQAKANIQLTGDYLADATLDTQVIALAPLLAMYAPGEADDVTGQSELHATLHGPLKNRNMLEAHVTVPTLKLAYGNTITLAAPSPIRVDYKGGVVQIQPASIRGTETDLQFQGSIPTTNNAPMTLKVLGTVNLQIAQLFDPDVRSSGELKFNIDSHGAIADTNIGGQIDIVDANYSSLDMPVALQHANGVLTLTKNRVNISSLQGTVGGGTVAAQGGLTFSPRVQFDIGLAAKGVRLLYPDGMREAADANLRFTGSQTRANLAGTVSVTDLSFTPAFDLNTFVGQFTGGVASPPSTGFAQNVSLNIAVNSTGSVNLVSRTVSVGGSASLQVRGTAADPVILGRVNLTGGDIILNGTRFVLDAGTVQFINPAETQPVVNLALNTTIQQYNIHLRFNGPTDQLKTQYTSDPALPQADIINLLAFGQTTEAAAAAGSTTTSTQAAQSVIASQVSSQVTSRISKVAGISQLTINPVLANSSNQGSPGANITVQQRVTGNLFVTFSTNVGAEQNQTIQGQYQVSPRVAVSVTSAPNGGIAFDTLIKKSW